VQPHDEPHRTTLSGTRAIVEQFMGYWAVQDVTETVALLADDAVSVVYLDDARIAMSGEIVGRDAITEGLYGNLATWHYRTFDWAISGVDGDTARVHITFDYLHQKTEIAFAGTMRMVITVHDDQIVRVECFNDGPRATAYMTLIAEREAAIARGE
jgi:ketosteroid isomerase-like protein